VQNIKVTFIAAGYGVALVGVIVPENIDHLVEPRDGSALKMKQARTRTHGVYKLIVA